jgi:hypothetical protein
VLKSVTEGGIDMAKSFRLLLVFCLAFLPSVSRAGGSRTGVSFDGKWITKMTCQAQGKTEGYTWEFPAVVNDGDFYGEHGNAGDSSHLIIEGKISNNGSAKLTARGPAAARNYNTGLFTTENPDYSYKIKAMFKDTQGTGTRENAMGAGPTCTFDFARQEKPDAPEQ